MTGPDSVDPVREAFDRYLQRFPTMAEARFYDPTSAALLKQMERMLIIIDCAMQDEGLDPVARRRVISAALFGGPDQAAAERRMEDHARQAETLRKLGLKVETKMPDV